MGAHYERLSYLDNSFLALESRTTHMHVAGMMILEAEPVRRADGGVDIDRIRAFVESKLHLIPRYRQHLAFVPIERHPVWVDDAHFNINYHIRHTSLPRPGSFEQLTALMGRLSSQQLDRSKPLWEMSVVEGLEGDHFAIISKIHHAMIDGISGVDLMAVLLNLAPGNDVREGPPYEPRPAPSGTDLVWRETARRVGRLASAFKSAQTLTSDAQALAVEGARRARAMRNSLGSGWLTAATKTPLNGTIGPNRRFATLQSPLAEVKEIKKALGGTVNDVVLATVAGGVRRFLIEDRAFDVDGVDFRVMAPVSVRSPSQRGTLGNQVAMWLASLPVSEPDPIARLVAVQRETQMLKTTDQALGAASLVRLSAGAPATLVSLAGRLASAARPFNMTVTNVPGPQFPLYLLGSKLLGHYPLVPLWQSHGVGIALFSYDGQVSWGFNADYDIMEDLAVFVAAVRWSFEQLLAAAREEKPSRRGAEHQPSAGPATTLAPKKRPLMGSSAARSGSKGDTAREKTPAPQKAGSQKAGSQKAGPQKAATKRAAPRKTAAKKPATNKPATNKPVAKKAGAKASPSRTATRVSSRKKPGPKPKK